MATWKDMSDAMKDCKCITCQILGGIFLDEAIACAHAYQKILDVDIRLLNKEIAELTA